MTQQIDLFLKIVGTKSGKIKGESQDSKHAGDIEAESYNMEVTQPISMGSGGVASGKRQHGFFVVTFKTQTASPLLMLACCNGEHLKEVILVCRKAGKEQQEYLKWTLKTALVAKFETFFREDSVLPHDRISFAYRQIEVEYREQKADGTLGGPIVANDDLTGIR
ncbi:MAG TPA: type VI secretion system tube protein Hcp [Bryobacteraceae bacterium]|nr:type VI secretion system tube protein Hcp [Bryobacteraceae bacterium]